MYRGVKAKLSIGRNTHRCKGVRLSDDLPQCSWKAGMTDAVNNDMSDRSHPLFPFAPGLPPHTNGEKGGVSQLFVHRLGALSRDIE